MFVGVVIGVLDAVIDCNGVIDAADAGIHVAIDGVHAVDALLMLLMLLLVFIDGIHIV